MGKKGIIRQTPREECEVERVPSETISPTHCYSLVFSLGPQLQVIKHRKDTGLQFKLKKNLMQQQLIAELKVKLIDILNLQDVTPDTFDENAQLVGGELGIDSIDVLEMVVMVEKDYGIVINNQEVGEKVFSSLTSLAAYITEHSARASA